MSETASNVVRFKSRVVAHGPQRHPKSLMEAVYTAGSLAVPADDLTARTTAALLHAMGFLVIDEIGPEGSRRLGPGEPRGALLAHPWRLSRPAFGGGEVGEPEIAGAFPPKVGNGA